MTENSERLAHRLLPLFFYLGLTSAGCMPASTSWNGTLIDPPMEIEDFELVGTDGLVRKESLAGRHVALVFGYTNCPDFCPATMARMAKVMDLLDDRLAEQIDVVLVTVDPERDTPEMVHDYARSFDPSFSGLSGTRDALTGLTESIGIFSERAHDENHGGGEHGYLVNHTTHVIVLDLDGRMRLVWSFEVPPADMAEDLNRLL